MATEWNKTVMRVYRENKHKAGYKFKDALVDAKKVYNGGKKNQMGGKNKSRNNKSVKKSIKSRNNKSRNNKLNKGGKKNNKTRKGKK